MRAHLILLALLLSAVTSAQNAFEVASIRLHQGPIRNMDITTSGPNLTAGAYPVQLIMYAYNLKAFQVMSSASMPLGDFYDVAAKAPGSGIPSHDDFRAMLQTLLADRFRLKFHRETRETPVYALVIAKNGPKFKPSAADADPTAYRRLIGRNNQFSSARASMDQVVAAITNAFLDRPVVDQTGLAGTYDLTLTYTTQVQLNSAATPNLDAISVFTAVQDQLGLKLEPRKATVEYLVIDSVEKPSPN